MQRAGSIDDVLNGGRRLVVGCLQFHGGYGAENLVGDVGEDGGAARGNAILRQEEKKAGEEVVQGGGGVEFFEVAGEVASDIGLSVILRGRGVPCAEFGAALGD